MGRTVRSYRRFIKFGFNFSVKSRRGQIPQIKRRSHHQHRHDNQFSDDFSFITFHHHQHLQNEPSNLLSGPLRNSKYQLYNSFKQFNTDLEVNLSTRAKLQNEILKRRKMNYYDSKVAKNGLYTRDLLQMAWKMLKRRGSLQPFKGHRKRNQPSRRQLY